jgi:hypothetical protein
MTDEHSDLTHAIGDGGCMSREADRDEPVPGTSSSGDQIDTAGTVAEPQPLVSVKVAFERMEGRRIYPMTAHPRGFCVIINMMNYTDFDGTPDEEYHRKGSKEEAETWKEVFLQLGFLVGCYEDLTADKLVYIFEHYSKKEELESHEAFVAIVMTHGEKDVLIAADKHTVKTEDILSHFNNSKCPALVNKPKLFLLQACRGGLKDYGVKIAKPLVTDAMLPVERVSNNTSSEEIVVPTWSDMVICHATIPGYVALRHENTGSWFGEAMRKILIEHACEFELNEIFMKVNETLMSRETGSPLKQSMEVCYRGWTKNFYFNPGIYEI